jgi:hypothetical protein
MREGNQTARRAGGRRSAPSSPASGGAQTRVGPDYLGEAVDQDGALDYPNNVMIFACENVQLLHGR